MRNAGLEEAQAGIKILGEISVTSAMQMIPPLWQKVKRLLVRVTGEGERANLRLNIKKI